MKEFGCPQVVYNRGDRPHNFLPNLQWVCLLPARPKTYLPYVLKTTDTPTEDVCLLKTHPAVVMRQDKPASQSDIILKQMQSQMGHLGANFQHVHEINILI